MFFKREHVTLTKKSKEIYDKLIDPESILYQIKKEFDFSFIYDEIKKHYCYDNGRNSIDGVLALRAIFAQKLFSLSERGLERNQRCIPAQRMAPLGGGSEGCGQEWLRAHRLTSAD